MIKLETDTVIIMQTNVKIAGNKFWDSSFKGSHNLKKDFHLWENNILLEKRFLQIKSMSNGFEIKLVQLVR